MKTILKTNRGLATAAVLALGTLAAATLQNGLALGSTTPAASGSATMAATRFGGADREATAIQVADGAFGHGTQASVAVLSRDDNFADALAGNALAAHKNGPLLVTPTAGLSPAVGTELTKILGHGAQVYLLGGTSALSDQVVRDVTALGFTPIRLTGADRFDTATKIAAAISPHPHTVLVATGDNAPDALAAGAAAATDPNGGVVLLSNDNVLPAATLAYLSGVDPAATAIYGVGVQGVNALNSLPKFVGRFTGFKGADRFDTDAQVASNTVLFPSPTSAGLASGDDGHWPDALAGGAYMGLAHAPLLLSAGNTIDPHIAAWLTKNGPALNSLTVFGGLAVVPQSAENAAVALASGSGAPPVPTPSIVPPTPALVSSSSRNAANTGQSVAFDASGSKVGSAAVKSYTFDFGDKSPAVVSTTPITAHAFTAKGKYVVKVLVTDADGGSATAQLAFYVSNPTVTGGGGGGTSGTPVKGHPGLLISAGVEDTHHTSGSKGTAPSVWCNGAVAPSDPAASSASVIFYGGADDGTMCGSGWDTPGIRIQNTGSTTATVALFSVTLPGISQNLVPGTANQTAGNASGSWSLWPQAVTLNPGQTVIFAQMFGNNFDPADRNNAGDYANHADAGLCLFPSPAIPAVHLSVNGSSVSMPDGHQIMNEHGTDAAGCSTATPPPPVGSRSDESVPWQGL